MEEISVVVKQNPGQVSWNFEEIKAKLSEELQIFKTTVYTDETIKTARTDLANLRKLEKEIESRREEVKDKCLEPYALIEKQAKEIVSLINEPIKAINEQVDDYEKRRKDAVRKEIEAYWDKEADKLPEALREKAHQKIYDNRWENATATKKSWKEGIDSGIDQILKDLETISSFKSDFEEDMMEVYRTGLNLQPAILKMNDLNAQRERVMEMERRKKEEAERKAKEEAERKEAEESAKMEPTKEQPVQPQIKPVANVNSMAEKTPQMQKETPHEPADSEERETITLFGTRQQIEKIKAFVVYTGAKWQEGAVNEFFG